MREEYAMNEKKEVLKEPVTAIPYAAHEALMDRAERRTKRWMIASCVLLGIVAALLIFSPLL
jgi:hypothetical protein